MQQTTSADAIFRYFWQAFQGLNSSRSKFYNLLRVKYELEIVKVVILPQGITGAESIQ